MMSSPFKLLIQPDFCSGTVFSRMSPKVPLKVDFPLRDGQFCIRVHISIIIIFGILDFAIIKRCLQFFDIFPWLLHRLQFHFLGKPRKCLLLFLRWRIVLQKGFKLRFVPHPRLLQSCHIAASKEQS